MISKELFEKSIESIRLLALDKNGKNNFNAIRVSIEILEMFFPKDENGFSEIEFYCIFCNFGKPNIDSEYESPIKLYERLIKNQSK